MSLPMPMRLRLTHFIKATVVFALVISSLTIISAPTANAATAGTGNCATTVDSVTGVNVVENGNFCYLVFWGSNAHTFTAPTGVTSADLLIIAGGGAGGAAAWGGGGGAGELVLYTGYGVSSGSATPVSVGPGGTSGTNSITNFTANRSTNGTNSWVGSSSGVVALPGGAGASYAWEADATKGGGTTYNGGSGGGATEYPSLLSGGTSTATSSGSRTGYGNNGGANYGVSSQTGGGGGGSGAAGVAGGPAVTGSGAGGSGTTAASAWITAISSGMAAAWQSATSGGKIAGGGGGGATNRGAGGAGGGGAGGNSSSLTGDSGVANTGSGGGGASYNGGGGYGGAGANGLVVVKYRFMVTATFNSNYGTPTTSTQSIAAGSSTALTANAFTRSGYSFAGWAANADGTGVQLDNSASVTITAATTYYATWTTIYTTGLVVNLDATKTNSLASNSATSWKSITPGNSTLTSVGWNATAAITTGSTIGAVTLGSAKYVDMGKNNVANISGAITVETWVKCTSLVTANWNIIATHWFTSSAGSVEATDWHFDLHNGKLELYIGGASATSKTGSKTFTQAADCNKWMLVGFTQKADGKIQFYVNGQPDGAEQASALHPSNAGAILQIGDGRSGSEGFVGSMSRYREYNVALTAAQILGNYNAEAATYGLSVNSTDATLSGLAVSSGSLGQVFTSGSTSYSATVPYTTTSTSLTATSNESNATLQVRLSSGSYTSLTSAVASGSLALNVGANTINVLSTAQDGSTTSTYTITITRTAAATVSSLSNLVISSGTLEPSFASGSTTYTASVSNATTSMTLTPTATNTFATMQIRLSSGSYTSISSGVASGSLALSVGANTINVLVTAQDLTTTTYTLTVTRATVAPTVDTSPSDVSTTYGSAATFSVSSTSNDAGALSYQWQVSVNAGSTYANVSSGSGYTTASYSTGSLAMADSGKKYQVIVTNTLNAVTASATSTAATLMVNKASQSITATISPTTTTYSGSAYRAVLTLSNSGSSGTGAVTYAVTNGTSTTCNVGAISSGSALTSTSTGTCLITATIAADGNYEAATSSAVTFTFSKASQTITFASLTNKTYGDANFSISGSSTSSLTVVFTTANNAVCTVTGTTISIVSAGTCTIYADQAGDENYLAATRVTQSFTIAALQLLTPAKPTLTAVIGSSTSITSTFSSIDHASSYTARLYLASDGTTLVGSAHTNFTSGDLISGLTSGVAYKITITAIGDGANYADSSASALSDSTNANVAASEPSIGTAALDATAAYGTSATFGVVATTSDAGSLSYQWQLKTASGSWGNVSSGSGATTSSYTTAALAIADHNNQYRVIVSNTFNTTTAPTTSAAAILSVIKAAQPDLTITSTSATFGSGLTLTTSGGTTGTTPTYGVTNGTATGCSITSGVLTVTTAGTCTVIATMAGSDNFNDISSSATTITFRAATLATPAAPTATAASTTSITATFTSIDHASSYTAYVYLASDGTTLIGSAHTNFTSGNSITGLTSNTSYKVTITAIAAGTNYSSSSASPLSELVTTQTAADSISIDSEPTSITQAVGTTATFSVAATSNGTMSYQWQRSTNSGATYANIGSATSDQYSVTSVALSNNGYRFRVIVTNSLNATSTTITSSAATLTIPVRSGVTTFTPVFTLGIASQTYMVATQISAATGMAGKVAFTASGRPIPGCTAVRTVENVATCNWRPSSMGSVVIAARFTPTDTGYAVLTKTLTIKVARR